ncbi:MAG: DUF4012 domain-containing protein [Actinomycetota bacterium]
MTELDLPERVERRKVRTRVRVKHKHSRRKRGRRRLRIALIVLGVLILLTLLAVIPALGIRSRLDEARVEMRQGLSALLAGEAEEAGNRFFAAEDAFLRAQDQAENPLLRAAGYLPVLGRTPDAMMNMSEAGVLVARSGQVVSAAMAELPEGTIALAPERGAISLRPLRTLAPAFADARELVVQARAVMDGSPATGLLGPVDQAQGELVAELDRAERVVTAAAAMTRALPGYLGGGGVRRYFLAAQNPAELRGTGGFIGQYAIMTTRRGRVDLSDFRTIDTLPDADASDLEPPNADFAARYDRYGGAGFWRNINMTADFPSAAVSIERLYEEVTGTRLDGVIAADPFALAALMESTGEDVTVPGTDRTVDAGSVVDYVTNQAYAEFSDQRTRKRLLGDLAEEVFDRFLTGGFSGGPVQAGGALVAAAADGHLVLHSTKETEQRAFRAAEVAGALGSAAGDALAVVTNNAGANKIDFFLGRSIRYEVRLGAEGTGTGDLTLELANAAPRAGQPRYVIGPHSDAFKAGENVSFLDVYCSRQCGLGEVRIDGRAATAGGPPELGHQVFSTEVRIPSGATRILKYRRLLSEAWEGDDGGGTYRLTFRGQTTIKPASLVVDVRAPEGMHIVRASPGMRVDGGRAVWEGQAGDLMVFEVEFQRPMTSRMWRTVVRFLSRPVI